MGNPAEIPAKKGLTRDKKRLIFYVLILAFPVVQFCIFYIFLNFTAFKLAFQKYENDMSYVYTFENFVTVFKFLAIKENYNMIFNSLIFFAFNLVIGSVAALFFSYYIFKQYTLSELFRVVLFLPQIISAMVLTLLFRFLATDVYTALTGNQGLLDNPDTRLTAIVIYNLWLGFGVNILMYSSAMSGINESIIESSSIDGASSLQEFGYIVFPMVYSTFVTFTIVAVSGIFTNNLNIYSLYADRADVAIQNIGYYIFAESRRPGNTYWNTEGINLVNYCQLAALGIVITVVLLPITLFVRKILEKIGPSVE